MSGLEALQGGGLALTKAILCESCNKPIVTEALVIPSRVGEKKKFNYHLTPMDCANAEPSKKNWRKSVKRQGADSYIRTQA